MLRDALAPIFVAVNWIAIGCVFASAILTAAVMAVLIGRVVWDRLHALAWQGRREAAQAAPREPNMPIPLFRERL